MSVTPAEVALELLKAGNVRFLADATAPSGSVDSTRREQVATGQDPFAVILGCADSRVPAELVFDQGIGDLFVIRVAGHVVGPAEVGSVEYAVEHCDARLVVVLGHSGCGAVGATLTELDCPSGALTDGVKFIVDRVGAAVRSVVEAHEESTPEERLAAAVYENVRATVATLASDSEMVRRMSADDGLVVIGAVYDLESGIVMFLDDVEDSRD